MTDLDLLLAGCIVSFIALAGTYAYIRQSYNAQKERRIVQVPASAAKRAGRKAA